MPAVKLEQFGGQLPAWDAHLLPTGQAAASRNTYLFGGNLTGWRAPKVLRLLKNSAAAAVFRIPSVQQSQARAYLLALLPVNQGDTATIGDIIYTFVQQNQGSGNGGALGRNDILIASSTQQTFTNLVQAITADNGQNTNSGVNYGGNTEANGDIYYTQPGTTARVGMADPSQGAVTIGLTTYQFVSVGAADFGASYNNIVVASTGARLQWNYDLAALGHTTNSLKGGSNPFFDSSITGASQWLEFLDPDTNVVKSPIVDDTWNRYYWASPSQLPQYNTYDRIAAADPAWLLGVPPPGCAPILTVAGGGNNQTFGNFTLSGGAIFLGGNHIYLIPIYTTGDTQIADIQWRLSGSRGIIDQNSTPTTLWAGVIYTDDGTSGDVTKAGKPANLLNTTEIVRGVTSDVPNIAQFRNPTALLGNTVYWIGFIIDTQNYFEGGPAGGGSNMTAFPANFTNGPPGTAPASVAHSLLTSDGTEVANGDQVIIGHHTYTFQTVLTNSPDNVKIGGSPDLTLQNLADCINANPATAGTAYAVSSAQNQLVIAGVEGNLQLPMTVRDVNFGGSDVTTISGAPHLKFPQLTFFDGMTQNMNSINLWGDFVTSDIIEARSYAYTWVTAYDEEGPPSPPTILDGWSNGTWSVGLWLPPADDLGVLRNITKLKLYRTVPGVGGATVFFLVDTVLLSDLATDYPSTPNVQNGAYIDTKANNVVALNDQIKSTNWFPPPANLQGLCVLQNGMVVGFVGNEIWFCEPYRPHAWPPGYVQTTDFTIVGLGVTNGALVACTASHPYIILGNSPITMTMTKGSVANPCSSRGSILNGDKAVTYMSPNGLIQVPASGEATNTTDLWMTREKWQQNTPPKYARSIYLASTYYSFGTVSPPSVTPADNSLAQNGFSIELEDDARSFTIWPQPGGHRQGFTNLGPTGVDIRNVMTDVWSGTGMLVTAAGDVPPAVRYYDFSDPAPTITPYTWRSKIYQQNVKRQYSAMKVFFSIPPGTTPQPAGYQRNTAVASDPSWATLGAYQYGILRTYVDVDGTGNMVLIDCREIMGSGALLRVVDGFKAEQWQWEVTARVNISNIQIATTPKELGGV